MLSNPTVFSLAAIRSSLDIFNRAGGIGPLREKSLRLTGYLRFLLEAELGRQIAIFTPRAAAEHGCQLSLSVRGDGVSGKEIFERIQRAGVACDWRKPDVIRVAPVPLYNRFAEMFDFVRILKEAMNG